MADLLTVVGHELRYMPRKQEPDRRNPGRFIDYEPAYLVITRLQGMLEGEDGQPRLGHITLPTSDILPDDFGEAVHTLHQIADVHKVGYDMAITENEYANMKDARVWSPFAHKPESPRQGKVVGYLTVYVPHEHRREKRRAVSYAPQVVPYLSVLTPNDDDIDRIIHVRLLAPGASAGLVGSGKPSALMREMYSQMQHVPPVGVPIGSLVRVGISNGDYRLMTEDNQGVSMAAAEEEASA